MKIEGIDAQIIEVAGILYDASVDTELETLLAVTEGPELLIANAFDDCGEFDAEAITVPINIKGLVNQIRACR